MVTHRGDVFRLERERLVIMIEVAVIAGLATLLSLVKINAFWPNGGSISLEMIPLFIIAFRRGWKVGVLTGLITGLVDLLISPYVVHPIQLLLDYPVPFLLLGFAALFVKKGQVPKVTTLIIGVIFATLLRFLSHFASGVIWFSEFTPDGWNDLAYSAFYNASYLVPQMLITLAVLIVFVKSYPQFFNVKKI